MSDLASLRALVLENEALRREISVRNAIIVHLMQGLPVTIPLRRLEELQGLWPSFEQTKTLCKLTPPEED